MNILVDARCLSDEAGGIPRYVSSIISALAHRYRGHMFLLFFNGYKNTYPWKMRHYPSNCIAVQSTFPNKLFNISSSVLSRPTLDEITQKITGVIPDAVFMPNINFVSVSSNIPIVLTIHDLSFHHYPKTFSWRSRLWHRYIGVASLIRRSARIIAVSDHTRDEIIEQFDVDPHRVNAIPHANTNQVDSGAMFSRDQLGVSDEYMIAPGMGAGRKNLDCLLDAWCLARQSSASLSKMKLLITGIQHGNNTPDSVLCIGTVPSDHYRALLSHATAVVYPSRYEGFGFPILEAFAARTPVLASSCSSIPEIGRDAFYPFDPYDVNSLALALMDICNPAIADHFVNVGAAYAWKNSWDDAAIRTFNTIKEAYESK